MQKICQQKFLFEFCTPGKGFLFSMFDLLKKFGWVRSLTLEVRFDSSSTFESSVRFEFEKRWFECISSSTVRNRVFCLAAAAAATLCFAFYPPPPHERATQTLWAAGEKRRLSQRTGEGGNRERRNENGLKRHLDKKRCPSRQTIHIE